MPPQASKYVLLAHSLLSWTLGLTEARILPVKSVEEGRRWGSLHLLTVPITDCPSRPQARPQGSSLNRQPPNGRDYKAPQISYWGLVVHSDVVSDHTLAVAWARPEHIYFLGRALARMIVWTASRLILRRASVKCEAAFDPKHT